MIGVFSYCQLKLDAELCGFCGRVDDFGQAQCVACDGAAGGEGLFLPAPQRTDTPSLALSAPGWKLRPRLGSSAGTSPTAATTGHVVPMLLTLSEAVSP